MTVRPQPASQPHPGADGPPHRGDDGVGATTSSRAQAGPGEEPAPGPLEVLAANGFAVDLLSREQREVLAGLTAEELDLLVGIRSRLDEVGPEVVAHSEIAGAALF